MTSTIRAILAVAISLLPLAGCGTTPAPNAAAPAPQTNAPAESVRMPRAY